MSVIRISVFWVVNVAAISDFLRVWVFRGSLFIVGFVALVRTSAGVWIGVILRSCSSSGVFLGVVS